MLRYYKLEGIEPVEITKKEHVKWYCEIDPRTLVVDVHTRKLQSGSQFCSRVIRFTVETRFVGISSHGPKNPFVFVTIVDPPVFQPEQSRTWAEAKYVHHETVKEMSKSWSLVREWYSK